MTATTSPVTPRGVETPASPSAASTPAPAAPVPAATSTADTKVCPFCGERIKTIAIKCRFCSEVLDHSAATAAQRQAGAGAPVLKNLVNSWHHHNWVVVAVPLAIALVVGYPLGQMIYGARFQNAIGRVLSGMGSGNPSEGRTVFLTIFILFVIGLIGMFIIRKKRKNRDKS